MTKIEVFYQFYLNLTFFKFSKATIPLASPSHRPCRLYEPEARTHDSNIPEFQHSSWGEAPNRLLFLRRKNNLDAFSLTQ